MPRARGGSRSRRYGETRTRYISRKPPARTKRPRPWIFPKGATLAVEGSVLVLFRFFPYDSAARWHLFMVDFSGKSAAAIARQTGIERIEVPAGEFRCYRMEVVFHVFIFSPKVVCWVTTEKPSVIVRSVGKEASLPPHTSLR